MSSSTSNSNLKSGTRSAGRVLLTIFAMLVALEIFTRVKLFKMSKDFVRFAGYAERARQLTAVEGIRIAFIGNSSTERGVSLSAFAEQMGVSGVLPLHVDMFVADASKINTWYFMLNRYFWKPNLHPDLIILSYYQRNLADGNDLEIGRMAQFFTQPDDWGDVFRVDLQEPSSRMEFVLSSYWATYAGRERIKERVLQTITPGYKDFVQEVNNVNNAMHSRNAGLRVKQRFATHHALQRLLTTAVQHNTRLCFIAFPVLIDGKQVPYELNPEELRLIREAGMDFLDMRTTSELTATNYADEIHLTRAGAEIYTRELTLKLTPFLQKLQRQHDTKSIRIMK